MCDINNKIMNFPKVKQELSFGHAHGLRLHIKTVFGEREHPCNICDQSFGESGNPRKHMKERGSISVTFVTKSLVRVVTLESTRRREVPSV